jgi:aryl-alcohol dehydrogenase-like predicted oxidoreductase
VRLRPIAAELGCTPAQLALSWCVRNKKVSSVITGASRVEAAIGDLAE